MLTEDVQASAFYEPDDFCGLLSASGSKVLKFPK
jgi:hypothetical protein